ncbi:leucine-rich repeats and immunoglobulin-like domains protein 3 [Polistes fuscatus]|uniref:leucine-rich repeats and immunoglobulin-like domains protein 3 n=1 Tax=Polistes fuscatus TaxID=30207 RepID=UPI001CA9B464|nr:leucine-rich repeats and immunoglobulin-like domains protein 3 [Polistes fuscatus]
MSEIEKIVLVERSRLRSKINRSIKVKFLFLWILLTLNLVMADDRSIISNEKSNKCPDGCGCIGNAVICNNLELIEAPSGLPPWTENLDMSANKLGNNFTIGLSDATKLIGLKVNKNQLTQIPDLSFVKNLTHLSLTHNEITTINGSALAVLSELQTLDLSLNKITFLRRGSFLAPNKIMHLNLNMNQIYIIENGSLDNLTSLVELRLNRNNLVQLMDTSSVQSLSTALFSNLGKLRILELNRNEIQKMQVLSLKGLTSLQELRLKRNKISTLSDGAFWPLKNLILLQLDFNMLTIVKKGGLFGLENLKKLTLSHNHITRIESQAWDNCGEITELDLSYNTLTSIERDTFDHLDKLERLKMDHNQIIYISDGTFNSTPKLQVLDLNSNKISYMVEDFNGAFSPLSNLWKLGLAHNKIKSVNRNAFIGLSHVTELDLSGNDITSIQENAFITMPDLKTLKLNSRSLVCDCGLHWFSTWIGTHRFEDTEAHCGYPHWLQDKPLAQLHHTNFTCDEYPKPRIIEEPSDQKRVKGDNVTLICRATSTADAPIKFIWKRDNVELNNPNLQTDVRTLEGGVTNASSVLQLINVTHANAGKYQCMVSNTYGTTYSSKAKLSVLIYPSFSKIPRDIRVTAGSTARLECSAEGQPSPQIAWQKDGGNDFPAARERRMHMMPTDDVLFIVDVKMADTGVYSCTAQNLAGLIVANATLTILEVPSFVKPMENKEIIIGGSIVLECMASGSPRPKLMWRKNGSPLQITERHFFTAENQLLIIVNTMSNDAGSYECEMSNSLGSVVGASHLTVNPAPTTIVNEDNILGLIIITIVCCAVGTSVVWVVIIYQTRKRLNNTRNTNTQQSPTTVISTAPENQTHMYLDTSSQHSKDSGTGDSTNPSNDQLQFCLPEEMVTCSVNNEEETAAVNVADPLIRYTNHERYIHSDKACAV